MARLPSRDDLGPLPGIPAAHPGRGIAHADASVIGKSAAEAALTMGRAEAGVGQAMGDFGKTVGQVGTALYEADLKAKEFDAERAFQEFKYTENNSLDEQMRTVEPGQAAGFAERWADGYKERAKGVLSSIPEPLKGRYDLRLFDTERSLYGASAQFARGVVVLAQAVHVEAAPDAGAGCQVAGFDLDCRAVDRLQFHDVEINGLHLVVVQGAINNVIGAIPLPGAAYAGKHGA